MAEEKKTILIVDDEPEVIEFVKTVISEMGGFAAITASDGEKGLEKAKAEVPDLIILDVLMPGRPGFSVFREIRRDPKTQDIPVIMLTGIGGAIGPEFSEKDVRGFMGEGLEDFLEKPVDPKTLQAAVKKALES